MRFMSVTPEVSQPEMSALKLGKFKKSRLISVTPETHQSPMGPYVVVAPSGFESYAVTAICSEALSVKVQAGGLGAGGGGEGGDGLGEGGSGDGEGGGGEGEGGGGEGGGGEGEGGGGEGGGGEGEDGQQASLHFAESFLFFFRHNFVQVFCFVPAAPSRDLLVVPS